MKQSSQPARSPIDDDVQACDFFIFIFKNKKNFKNICQFGKIVEMGACRPVAGRQDL